MKEIQNPKVTTIKCNLVNSNWTFELLIGLQKISTSWIDLKILPHKLKERVQIFQQVLLNLDIECKSYSTLNWTWNYVRTLLVPLGGDWLKTLDAAAVLRSRTWSVTKVYACSARIKLMDVQQGSEETYSRSSNITSIRSFNRNSKSLDKQEIWSGTSVYREHQELVIQH